MLEPGIQPNRDVNRGRKVISILAIIGFSLFVGIRTILGYPLITTPSFNGQIVEPPVAAADIVMVATNGERVALHDFAGQITLVYFGYTFCPDVCPATMSVLSSAMERLTTSQRERVQVVMITVDPARDTPEKLAGYLAHFDPSFIGMVGTEAEIAAAAAAFSAIYHKHEGTVATGYLIDHTASVAVIDQQGQWRLTLPFGLSRDNVVAEIKHLMQE